MTDRKYAGKGRSGKKGRSHDPSDYRRIVKIAKKEGSDRNVRELVREAKKLNDPYYTSLALMSVSAHPNLPLDMSTSIAEQALKFSDGEERLWRRSELLIELVRKLTSWKVGSSEIGIPDVRRHLYQNVIERISDMPVGKHRSEAVKGVSSKLPLGMMESLMITALGNEGNVLDDMRTVVRWWIGKLHEEKAGEEDITTALDLMNDRVKGIDEPALRGKLYGYLDLQLRKNGIDAGPLDPFSRAVGSAVSLEDDEERLDTLRYLVSISVDAAALDKIAAVVGEFGDGINSLRLLTSLAGRGDKIGSASRAHQWLKKANDGVKGIDGPERRIPLRVNIMQGFALSGSMEDARAQQSMALSDCEGIEDEGHRSALENRITSTARRLGLTEDGDGATITTVTSPALPMVRKELSDRPHHIIALYDAYEGGVKPTHLRAIARAAPLCMAYDLDLALMGFPTTDLTSIVNATARETNIGRGGSLLEKLVEQDRVILVPAVKGDDPAAWNRLGTLVGTTSHPDPGKSATLGEISGSSPKSARGSSICLIMGLGRKGLPTSLLKEVPHHLELTGRNIPLETCTVMGILAERLRHLSSLK